GVFIVRATEHGSFEVEKKNGDTWRPECLFGRSSHKLEEFTAMCEFHQTSPESHFTKGRICSQMTENGRKTLSEKTFGVTTNGVKIETAVESEDEFNRILKQEFLIEKV
ncbi:MAG: arylamine N-acetyltransferase, partial [Acidobacteriota bacterium]